MWYLTSKYYPNVLSTYTITECPFWLYVLFPEMYENEIEGLKLLEEMRTCFKNTFLNHNGRQSHISLHFKILKDMG